MRAMFGNIRCRVSLAGGLLAVFAQCCAAQPAVAGGGARTPPGATPARSGAIRRSCGDRPGGRGDDAFGADGGPHPADPRRPRGAGQGRRAAARIRLLGGPGATPRGRRGVSRRKGDAPGATAPAGAGRRRRARGHDRRGGGRKGAQPGGFAPRAACLLPRGRAVLRGGSRACASRPPESVQVGQAMIDLVNPASAEDPDVRAGGVVGVAASEHAVSNSGSRRPGAAYPARVVQAELQGRRRQPATRGRSPLDGNSAGLLPGIVGVAVFPSPAGPIADAMADTSTDCGDAALVRAAHALVHLEPRGFVPRGERDARASCATARRCSGGSMRSPGPMVVAASGLADISVDSPYQQWLRQVIRNAVPDPFSEPHAVALADLSDELVAEGAEWSAPQLLLCPLKVPDGSSLGGIDLLPHRTVHRCRHRDGRMDRRFGGIRAVGVAQGPAADPPLAHEPQRRQAGRRRSGALLAADRPDPGAADRARAGRDHQHQADSHHLAGRRRGARDH